MRSQLEIEFLCARWELLLLVEMFAGEGKVAHEFVSADDKGSLCRMSLVVD